jgi:type II secretory pathway predicted ATPase ExeA
MDLLSRLYAGEFPDPGDNSGQQREALERLRYLAESAGRGLLLGEAGTGKSRLFRQLADELRRQGRPVIELNVSGLSAESLPRLVASRLGLGLPEGTDRDQVWEALQDHATGCRLTGTRHVVLIEDVDRSGEGFASRLDRLMVLLEGTACLVSARPNLPKRQWEQLLERCHLRIELSNVPNRELTRLTNDLLARQAPSLQLDAEACQAMLELTDGRLDRIQTLSELACLAAEIDDRTRIDRDLVQNVAEEMHLS